MVGQYGYESEQYRHSPAQGSPSPTDYAGYGQSSQDLPGQQQYRYDADPYQAGTNPYQQGYQPVPYAQQNPYGQQKSRMAAGLLAIFVGSLGVHNFYLARTGRAVLQLLLSLLSLGLLAPFVGLWALIEGILILVNSPNFAVDGKGIPLRD
jgi:TM2 domain-containing membrane protein YozV